MRAKSIKNSARVNAELSPAELKALLKKAQAATTSYQTYISLLEAEVAIWRTGGNVQQADWATAEKAGAPIISGGAKKPATSPSPATPSTARSMTPANPAVDALRGDLDSRPQTPTVIGLDKDEREEFLKRENELSDQVAEKEAALQSQEKIVKELREELTFIKEQDASSSKVTCETCLSISLKEFYYIGKQSTFQSTQ